MEDWRQRPVRKEIIGKIQAALRPDGNKQQNGEKKLAGDR